MASRFVQQGLAVRGSTTTEAKLAELEALGIRAFLLDIARPNAAMQAFLSAEVLVIAITTKQVDEVVRFIEVLETSAVKKVVFVSSTSVYPNTNGVVVETTPTLDSPLAQIEQLFLQNQAFETTVVRFGGLMGYDRKPGNFIREGKLMEQPEGVVNMIHRDDCLAIIEQIIAQEVWNEIFNACADSHPTRREFYNREAAKLGKPEVAFNEETPLSYKIISSEKLKDRLGYSFIYSDLMVI